MKSPAFQWYAADYLADERVAQLSLEAEAVYVRLLSYCWREGSIPAKPEACVPLCKYADVKVIKTALALFTKVNAPAGRLLHKRLEEERDKQEAFKAKQVINGKLGGRPRKATDNPTESQEKGLGFSGLTQTEPKKTSSSSTSSSTSSSEESSSLRSEDAPTGAGQPEKKIGGELSPESPNASASHTGGAADVDTRINSDKTDKTDTVSVVAKSARFVPPAYEDILAYMLSQRPHNPPADVERVAAKCFGYYSGNGWKVGRNPMKDWKGACQTFLADVPKLPPGAAPPAVIQPVQAFGTAYGRTAQPSQVATRTAAIAQANAAIDALCANDPLHS